jgi:beta-glucanase (GH16 family)
MKNIFIKSVCFLSVLFIPATLSAQKYVQVWGDEFDTPGLPDSTKWGYEIGKIRNNELQYYTSHREENARTEDTVLIIEARKEQFEDAEYTSASLISQGIGDWRYGKIEISAKVPTGRGTWPALWLLPTYNEYGRWPKSGEIDIMEYIGVEPQNLYYTAHFQGTDGTGHQSSESGGIDDIKNPFDQFIKFTLIWTPEKIEWFANDIKYHEYKKPADDYRVWPFDKEFYLILNLAYGGDWGGYDGVDDSKLPHQFLIDYVRVYQLQETEPPFNLTIEPANGGIVDVFPALEFYPENTKVILTAIPDINNVFKSWKHLSGANPFTFTIRKETIISPCFIPEGELLTNGRFDQSWLPWQFYVYNDQTASYTTSIEDGVLVMDIIESPGINWYLGFHESRLSMQQGNYQLSFDAHAEQQEQLLITVSKNYSDWSAYISKYVTITTYNKKHTLNLNMPLDDENVRLFFGVGNFIGKFYIDNISLRRNEQGQLLSNGEFDQDWLPWRFYIFDEQTTNYTASIEDGVFVIDITQSPIVDWQLGFQETGLSLLKGKYKLTFDAYAENGNTLLINVSKNHSDWGAHISNLLDITTSNQKHELTLDMPVDDENVRLYFGIGNFSGKFYIDNVNLSRIETETN